MPLRARLVLGGVMFGLYAWSAIHGVGVARQCRRARADWTAAGSPGLRHIEAGVRGGPCLPNGTCLDELTCHPNYHACVDLPPRGLPGGVCYPNLTCYVGSRCEAGFCVWGAIGSAGAPCYPNLTCDGDLVCDAVGRRCVSEPTMTLDGGIDGH